MLPLPYQHALSAFDVINLFGKVYIRYQTAQISINVFKVTGIYPLNSDAEYIEETINTKSWVFREQRRM